MASNGARLGLAVRDGAGQIGLTKLASVAEHAEPASVEVAAAGADVALEAVGTAEAWEAADRRQRCWQTKIYVAGFHCAPGGETEAEPCFAAPFDYGDGGFEHVEARCPTALPGCEEAERSSWGEEETSESRRRQTAVEVRADVAPV